MIRAHILGLLGRLEHLGNRLPHPTALFVWFSLAMLLISWLLSLLAVSATHPVTGDLVPVNNLLSASGIHRILTETVSNFTQFAPVGTVLIAMLGLGLAERSGLLGALLQRLVRLSRGYGLSALVVFAGVMSSLAADAGYVVLIPLAGLVFAAAGRHPLAGMAAAFAGVSGGYSANLMIGPIDAILAGISTEAARLVTPGTEVSVLTNYYFIVVSTLLITLLATLVTEKITLPALPACAPPRWLVPSGRVTFHAPVHGLLPISTIARHARTRYPPLFPAGALLWPHGRRGAAWRRRQGRVLLHWCAA